MITTILFALVALLLLLLCRFSSGQDAGVHGGLEDQLDTEQLFSNVADSEASFHVITPKLRPTVLIIDGLNYINAISALQSAIPKSHRKNGMINYPPFEALYRSVSYSDDPEAPGFVMTPTAGIFREQYGERPFPEQPVKGFTLAGPRAKVLVDLMANLDTGADRVIYVTKRIDDSHRDPQLAAATNRGIAFLFTKATGPSKDESDDLTTILLGLLYSDVYIMSNDQFISRKAKDHMSCVHSLQRMGHATKMEWDIVAPEGFIADLVKRVKRLGIKLKCTGTHVELAANNDLYHKLCDFIIDEVARHFIPVNPRVNIPRLALSLVEVNKAIKAAPEFSSNGSYFAKNVSRVYLERALWELIHRLALKYLNGERSFRELLADEPGKLAASVYRELQVGKAAAFFSALAEAVDGMDARTKAAFIKAHSSSEKAHAPSKEAPDNTTVE